MDNRQARALQTKDGWSASGPLTAGGEGLVQLQANFSTGGGLGCGQYTIQFTSTGNPNSNNPIFTEALITWSVEGNFLTRRVSVCNGMSITGSGQAVKVVITDNTKPIYNPQTPGIQYQVGCQVVPGVRANTEISPILYPLDNIFANGNPADPTYLQAAQVASGDYLQVFIPQDAGITSVLVTPIVQIPLGGHPTITPTIPDGTALVYIILNSLEIMSIYDCKIPFWYPLISSAQTLYLQNSNPSLTENYRFSVAFGIDG